MHQYQHEERCVEELGLACRKVHAFLDQYHPLFRSIFHRCVLHHQRGIDLAVRMFAAEYGEELTRAAAELHILDDMQRIPRDWNDMDAAWIPLHEVEEESMCNIIKELFDEWPDIVGYR
jgi:hypothetical protein